jgi:DNA polymerase-3 subunit epsilon
VTVATLLRDLWRSNIGRANAADVRWVVVDTETTGLDADTDRLLAIGAVAVDRGGIRLADSFEVLVQNLAPGDKANVVIHGIGYEAQREGIPIPQALAAFAAYVAGAPCVGFHCPFDRAVLARSAASAGVPLSLPRWLDLDPLAAALVPDVHQRGARSLDDWITVFDIDVVARHSAAGDALATAELLLRLRAVAARQGIATFKALVRVSRQRRWLESARS